LEENPDSDKIYWNALSGNPTAIHLIKKELENKPNTDKIDWKWLSVNPAIFEKTNEYILK
jgi:hypothetical protein